MRAPHEINLAIVKALGLDPSLTVEVDILLRRGSLPAVHVEQWIVDGETLAGVLHEFTLVEDDEPEAES